MKITNKADGDALAARLAGGTIKPKKHIIVAATGDLKDEATQSAQAYWMMGWSWDEIESVLEDSDYPTSVITHAITKTKAYADKVLNEGPFAVLKAGQYVCLANGVSGKLVAKEAGYIVVDVPDVGETRVTAEQVDSAATGKLREAFTLRARADRILNKVASDGIIYTKSASKIAQDAAIGPVLQPISDALSTIAALKHATDDLKHDAGDLADTWDAEHGEWAPASPQEKEFAQYVYATITVEKDLDSEITNEFYTRLNGSLTNLYNTVAAGASISNANLDEFLTHEFPHIASKLDAHFYAIRERNTKISEHMAHFEKFDAELGKEWTSNAVKWAADSWNTTKEFLREWEGTLLPVLLTAVSTIDSQLGIAQDAQVAASVSSALNTLKV